MTTKTKETDYSTFIERKSQLGSSAGFEPLFMPDFLFPFQRALVEWAVRKGRCAIFADCGLGKTFVQLVWAENVARQTNGRVLILTPLAVAFQTVREGEKIGVEHTIQRDLSDYVVATRDWAAADGALAHWNGTIWERGHSESLVSLYHHP